MSLFFDIKEKIVKSGRVNQLLKKSCPNCDSDLVLTDLKQWFSLFLIPLFPFYRVDTYYHCSNCNATYTRTIGNSLIEGTADKVSVEAERKKLFCYTLFACMTHMANIDGEITENEAIEIDRMRNKFKDYKADIDEVIYKVKESDNPEEFVYAILRQSSVRLTSKDIMSIIGESAKVLLADEKITKEEERLLKEYLIVCGIPKDLYSTIVGK
ncbi:MAG: zinc-ribbon domain-containing protein [Bacteroidales bacterium]|jgi:uncharacterized tellurite resistance protein B-like protein|nr:zinc-ribbon domain-containing protein [Bacteroidales bacterium]